jgi:hypothetical protein
MRKVFLFVLAALLVFPVVAYAENYVGIDGLRPLFCGTGSVPVKGTTQVMPGDPYTKLKVVIARVAPTYAVLVNSSGNSIPADANWHDWSFQVPVTEGHTYQIIAALTNASGFVGKQVSFYQQVQPCDDSQLNVLNQQVVDAYGR